MFHMEDFRRMLLTSGMNRENPSIEELTTALVGAGMCPLCAARFVKMAHEGSTGLMAYMLGVVDGAVVVSDQMVFSLSEASCN